MEKIRVLEVLRDAEGGMKKHVETLVMGLDKDKFAITLACAQGQFDKEKLKNSGITVYEINIGDKHSAKALVKSLWDLIRIIKKENIQILHVHGMSCAIIGTIATLLARTCRVVSTIHNFPVYRKTGARQRFSNNLAGVLLKFNYKVIAVSWTLGTSICQVWGIPQNKVVVMYNGIDPVTIGNLVLSTDNLNQLIKGKLKTDNSKIILNIARLIPEKGVDTFIEAANILLKRTSYSDLLFLIAGDGPLEFKLKKIVRDLGIEDNLQFLGYRNDIYNLINMSDIVVLSSRTEGLGLALLEAMAFKKPVIGSNVGGIPEIIEDGKTGFLVPPNNPEALAGSILDVLYRSDSVKAVAEEGYKSVLHKFSKESMLNGLQKLFCDLLSDD